MSARSACAGLFLCSSCTDHGTSGTRSFHCSRPETSSFPDSIVSPRPQGPDSIVSPRPQKLVAVSSTMRCGVSKPVSAGPEELVAGSADIGFDTCKSGSKGGAEICPRVQGKPVHGARGQGARLRHDVPFHALSLFIVFIQPRPSMRKSRKLPMTKFLLWDLEQDNIVGSRILIR